MFDYISIVPGDRLLATALVRKTAGAGTLQIEIGWLNAAKSPLSTSIGGATTSATFTRIRAIAIAPAGAAFAKPVINVIGRDANTEADYDQFVVKLAPTDADISNEQEDGGLKEVNTRDLFLRWRKPGDPQDIMPEVLAARCLGITYGDPGPKLPDGRCRKCWGDRYIWYGNAWGLKHAGDLHSCECACHAGEVFLAGNQKTVAEDG